MTYLKSIWADLVEKRLWPVAAALVAALVAVPFLLGGSDTPTAVAPATPAAAAGAAALRAQVADVALDPVLPVRRNRPGKVRNPFTQRKVVVVKEPTTTTATAVAPDAATSSGGTSSSSSATPPPSSSGGGSPAPTTSTPGPAPKPAAPKPDPRDSYVVAVRFGKTESKRAIRILDRLTPLPTTDPFLVQLGVLSDGKTVVFLLSTDVTATGDGACKPRKSNCETIELVRGDTETLSVTGADGEVTEYQLDVLKIAKEIVTTPSRAVAARSEAEEDEIGTEDYTFDARSGTLHRVKRKVTADADSDPASGTAASAGDDLYAAAGFPGVRRGVIWYQPVPLPAALRHP